MLREIRQMMLWMMLIHWNSKMTMMEEDAKEEESEEKDRVRIRGFRKKVLKMLKFNSDETLNYDISFLFKASQGTSFDLPQV